MRGARRSGRARLPAPATSSGPFLSSSSIVRAAQSQLSRSFAELRRKGARLYAVRAIALRTDSDSCLAQRFDAARSGYNSRGSIERGAFPVINLPARDLHALHYKLLRNATRSAF